MDVLVDPTTSSGNARGWGIVSCDKMYAHTLSSDFVNGDWVKRGIEVSSSDEPGMIVDVGIEFVGNKWMGRSEMKLGSKRESCQYSCSASSREICPPAVSWQKRACARRFSCTPPILDMMRRQRSRASGVVQKVTLLLRSP